MDQQKPIFSRAELVKIIAVNSPLTLRIKGTVCAFTLCLTVVKKAERERGQVRRNPAKVDIGNSVLLLLLLKATCLSGMKM